MLRTIEWVKAVGLEPRVIQSMQFSRCRAILCRRLNQIETLIMSELHRVTVDPTQCGGRPCLRGLRIRVRDVLDLLAEGASSEEILADYPMLEAGDIAAALEYAARASDHPVLRVA